MMSNNIKRISIGCLVVLCAVLLVYSIIAPDKPYKHLRVDNLYSIELNDIENNAVKNIQDTNEMQKVIDTISQTKTYTNVMLKDVPEIRYKISLVYDGGRTRDITFAIEKEGSQVVDSKSLCITENKRWYRIKKNQAQELLKLYDEI